eukprot:m.63696 g.63696  ORF g.63696 m.63696 type:complete len:336 (+) comp9673_c0_seq1:83-1090(+)
MAGPLSAEEVAAYDRDGFVIVRNFFPAEVVESVRQGLTEVMEDQIDRINAETPGALPDKAEGSPFETRFMDVFSTLVKTDPSRVPLAFRPELQKAQLYSILYNQKLLDAVQQLLPSVSELRLFPNYTSRPKLPQFEPHRVVWHQDAGLDHRGAPNSQPVDARLDAFGRDAMVNVWTGFVPVGRKEGCMLMIPGTQRLGCVEHTLQGLARDPGAADVKAVPDTMADNANVEEYSKKYQEKTTFTTSIRPDIVEAQLGEKEAVPIETNPGDVVLFQNLTFHCGTTNTSEVVRWSLDWRYQDATKPTHRPPQGHIVRSATAPDKVIASAEAWAAAPFQ